MKLAFSLFKYFPYGGLQRDCIKIAQECVARGHQVDIFALEASGEVPEPLTITCLEVKARINYRRYEQFAAALKDEIKAGNYDAVVGFNRMAGLDFYFGADPCFAAKVGLKPYWYRFLPRNLSFLRAEKEVYAPTSHTQIFLLSNIEIDAIKNEYATQSYRFHLLPPAVEQEYFAPPDYVKRRDNFRQKLGVAPEENMLLMVGSGFRVKGVDRSLKALSCLPQKIRANSKLFVLGIDNKRPFQRLATKLGLKKQVYFMNGRNDAHEFMFAADLLLHPAHREAAGMVLVEAIAARLPVIATDTCGYSFHIKNSAAGIVHSSPFNLKRFSLEIESMLAQESWRWQNAAAEYVEKTDLSGMAKKAVDIIEQQSTLDVSNKVADVYTG